MIHTFIEFLLEKTNTEWISGIISALLRSYEVESSMKIDDMQLQIEKEERNWEDTRASVSVGKTEEMEGSYHISYHLDGSAYVVDIEFTMTLEGRKEKDTPDMEEIPGAAVVLKDVRVKSISAKAGEKREHLSEFSSGLKETLDRFMVKALAPDYDTLGEKFMLG